jgi:hypothetical protein
VRAAGVVLVAGMVWRWGPASTRVFDNAQPFRSMLLVVGPAAILWTWRVLARRPGPHAPDRLNVLLILSLFSLAAITRVFLNVSVLSPYTAFTVLPGVLVYSYLFLEAWPSFFPPHRRAPLASASLALMAAVVVSMVGIGIAYARTTRTTEIRTARGTLRLDPPIGGPLAEAIRFAATRTAPDDPLIALPEGSVINFMADRRNPLKDEIVIPGYLTPDREQETIQMIDDTRVPVVLLLNRVTPEYRDVAFGVDYNQDLVRWIEAHYRPVATFPERPGAGELQFGDRRFFIRAYERITPPARSSAPLR